MLTNMSRQFIIYSYIQHQCQIGLSMFSTNQEANPLKQRSRKQRTYQQASAFDVFISNQLQNISQVGANHSEELQSLNYRMEEQQSNYNNCYQNRSKYNSEQFQNCVYYIAKQFKQLQVKTIEYYLKRILQQTQKKDKKNQSYIDEYTTEQDAKYSIQMSLIKLPTNRVLGEEQKVAASFVNYGYGLRVLKQTIEPFIPGSRYNNSISTVIKFTFRKIEERMRIFGNSIIPISLYDQQILKCPLMNCYRWLPLDELYTFFRYVKLTFNLEQEVITPRDTTKLYTSIMKKLKQKSMSNTNNHEERKKLKMQENCINQQKSHPIDYPMYNPDIKYPSNSFLPYNPHINYVPILNLKTISQEQGVRKMNNKEQIKTEELQKNFSHLLKN